MEESVFQQENHVGWKYAAWGVIVLTAFLMFTNLGSYPMQMQWEPNYGQVLREMVFGDGDFITPASRVGADEGADAGYFWSKPILIFWLSYPTLAVLGSANTMPDMWHFRLSNAAVGLLGVIMFWFFMTRLYHRRMGVIAALVYATTTIYFVIARAYIVDVLFVNFWIIAYGFFLLGEKTGKAKYYYLFYVFLGVSMLAKGLLPLVLTGGIFFFYLLITWDWALLKRLRLHKGIPIFLAVGFAWYFYMLMRFGTRYADVFFYRQHFARAEGNFDKPNDTFELFVLYFSVGLLPWLAFLPQAISTVLPWNRGEADRKPEVHFVIGLAFTFFFFCIINTKFPHYIFPTAPFAALLIALYLDRWMGQDRKDFNRLSILIGLVVFAIVAPDILDKKNYRIIWYMMNTERLQDWHANVGDPKVFFSVIYGLWAAVLVLGGFFRRTYKYTLPVLGILAFTYAFYITNVMVPSLNWMFTSRTLLQQYYDQRKGDDVLAEFTQTWKSRSIKFEMQFDELAQGYDYTNYRIRDSLNSVEHFYEKKVKRPDGTSRRVFIIIEEKQKHFTRINNLWRRATGGQTLVKLGDDGDPQNLRGYRDYVPEFWLVSNQDSSGRMTKTDESQMRQALSKYVKENAEECRPAVGVPHETVIGADQGLKLLGFELFSRRGSNGSLQPLKIENWRVDKPEMPAGDTLVIRTVWECLKPVNRDLEIFIHVERPQGFRLRGDHVPVNNEYPVPEWKPGQCIIDEFEVDTSADTPTGDAAIFIGMFKENSREPVDNRPWREPDNRIKLSTIIIKGKY